MKQTILITLALIPFVLKAQSVKLDTVSTGANYVNQIWYSLANDEVGTAPKDNWDLAFELTGFNSSILVNTQKTGEAVYLSPYTWTNWSAFDTTGYKSWSSLHNSDTTWEIGALSRPGTYNTEDMGWGSYDMGSHAVLGTRLYLLVLPGNKFFQLGVKSLIAGTYTVTFKTLDDSDSTTFTIKKSDFPDKQFAYYNVETKTALNREPLKSDWDFTFTRFYTNIPVGGGQFLPYVVTGLLQNKGIKVAEVQKTDVINNVDYMNQTYTSRINEIGSDWKNFNNGTFKWEITDSLLYFVEDLNGDIWKVIMTDFSGSTAGNYMLSKQKLTNSSLFSFNANQEVRVYPNPSQKGSNLYVVCDFASNENVSITLTDHTGKIVYQSSVLSVNGFVALELPLELSSGVYAMNITSGSQTAQQKIIIQ